MDLEITDYTCVTKNLLHSLFNQRNVILNGVTITFAADIYHYRAYLETLVTHDSDASHLTNEFWYPDTGDLGVCDPTALSQPVKTQASSLDATY